MFGPGVLELCWMADMVFLALHGTCGEDGRVQAAFDLMGIPYTGAGYLGSAIAMDKDLTKRMVADVVSTPGWKTVTYTAADIDRLVETARLPLVVKPVASGSSIGVSIAHTAEELRGPSPKDWPWGGARCWRSTSGAGRSRWASWRIKPCPPLRSSPSRAFTTMPTSTSPAPLWRSARAEITPEEEARVRAAALRVYETLGLSVYSRADFILTEDGEPWFLEINTLPGMTPTSLLPQEAAAAGIDYNELCQRIVHASLEARKQGR